MALENIYCDESCHLEHDKSPVMVLGCIRFPFEKKDEINNRIKEIKNKYHISLYNELKWTKVSNGRIFDCYEDLINYFFDDDDLLFRALIVDNKQAIRHENYHQTHDDWYYKMYFNMLKVILDPTDSYNIYLDIKDTRSKTKVSKLQEILANNQYDFSRSIIKKMQVIRSNEVQIMQIVDLLIGAISHSLRDITTSIPKQQLIEIIKLKSKYDFTKNTLYREKKFNIFHIQLQNPEDV